MKFKRSAIILLSLLLSFICFGQSHKKNDSLTNALLHTNSDTVKINLLNTIARQYIFINKDSSNTYLQQALSLAIELDKPKFKAMTYTTQGSNFCFKGEYLKALESLNLANNILSEYPFKLIQANIHYVKSIVFSSIDELNLASEHADKALELFQDMNKLKSISNIYTVYSTIYEKLGGKQKSLLYVKKSYDISLELKDTIIIIANLNNLSSHYQLVGQSDSAYHYLRKAIVLNKKYNIKSWLAINYHNMGEYMLEDKKNDSADFYIQMALEIYQEIGYLINFYEATNIKANIAVARHNTLSATKLYHSIIESPGDLESLKVKVYAYKALYEIAHCKNQYLQPLRQNC